MSNQNNPIQWSWQAVYKDGSIYDRQQFNELNREQVKIINLFFNGEYRGCVNLEDETQRLILIRRNKVFFNEQFQSTGTYIIYLVGWQSTVNGKNVKALMELHPDGTIIMKNNDGRME